MQRGNTLIELLVVISIFGIVALFAVPSYSDLKRSQVEQESRNQVRALLRRARAEAIANGTRSIVKTTVNGSQASVGIDYLPYSNSAIEDNVLFFENLPEHVTLRFARIPIFNAQGYLVNAQDAFQTISFRIARKSKTFCSGTIYPAGQVEFLC